MAAATRQSCKICHRLKWTNYKWKWQTDQLTKKKAFMVLLIGWRSLVVQKTVLECFPERTSSSFIPGRQLQSQFFLNPSQAGSQERGEASQAHRAWWGLMSLPSGRPASRFPPDIKDINHQTGFQEWNFCHPQAEIFLKTSPKWEQLDQSDY